MSPVDTLRECARMANALSLSMTVSFTVSGSTVTCAATTSVGGHAAYEGRGESIEEALAVLYGKLLEECRNMADRFGPWSTTVGGST